jgi:hypothetical protein
MEVISSIYNTEIIGDLPFYDGDLYGNIKLHQGEVREIITPTDKKSISRKFNEYTVLVSQHERGTFAHKLYHNCLLLNPLGSGPDHSEWALRASTKPIEQVEDSDGSRVLILCIEGSNNQPVILGGLRDERCGSDPTGQALNWEYNGVNFKVLDDGSWSIVNKGKTNNLGKVHKDANQDGIGTTIKTDATGKVSVITPKGQSIILDNENDTITIKGNSEVIVEADKISLGEGASQPGVLGQELFQILTDLMSAIAQITVVNAGGPTSTPVNAAVFISLQSKLRNILSRQTYLKGNL